MIFLVESGEHPRCIQLSIILPDLREIWEEYERNMREIWEKYERNMREIWEKYERNMREIWEEYERNMRGIWEVYLVGISSGAESTLVVSRFERIILPDLRERLPYHFPREPKLRWWIIPPLIYQRHKHTLEISSHHGVGSHPQTLFKDFFPKQRTPTTHPPKGFRIRGRLTTF